MKPYTFLLMGAALAVLGAGCLPKNGTQQPAPKPAQEEARPVGEEKAMPAPDESAEAPGEEMSDSSATGTEATLTPVDDTWNTYTNDAAGFSFQWPTQGKYAPEWNVKFVPEADPAYRDGCYYDIYSADMEGRRPSHITVNGVDFCHAYLGDGFAGGFGYMDTYTGVVAGHVVSISFTKIVHSSGACLDVSPVCQQAFDEGKYVLSFGAGSYAVFDMDEYEAHLDQIIGTFRVASR